MSVVPAALETGLATIALGAIANERMRAYGLGRLLDARTVAISATVMLARGWLASLGVGDVDTSIAFALGAVAAITDLQCGYVFDRVLLAGGAALIAIEAVHGRLGVAVEGAVAAALLLAVPWALTRGRGLGFGDVKLAGVLGCCLGPYGSLRFLWFAFVLGAIASAARMLVWRRSREEPLPFAPFVALGAVLSAGGVTW